MMPKVQLFLRKLGLELSVPAIRPAQDKKAKAVCWLGVIHLKLHEKLRHLDLYPSR
jgi:hypothetical protein